MKQVDLKEGLLLYQSKDGKVFNAEQECLDYEKVLDFTDWYDNQSEGVWCYDKIVTSNVLFDFLTENKEQILKFLSNPIKEEITGFNSNLCV